MSTNLDQFLLELGDFANRVLPAQFVVFHQKIHLALAAKIVQRNPVLTGRSRGNWQSGVATNEEGVADWYTKGEDETVADAWRGIKELKPYGVSFLWNNVNYIVFLEEGSSQQAPEGFVALSIADVEAMFEVQS